MSISLNVVRCAVACCDSSRCSAMRLRRVVIFSRVSRSPAGGGRAERATGARRGGWRGLRAARQRPRRRGSIDVGLADDAAASGALNLRRGRRPARRRRAARPATRDWRRPSLVPQPAPPAEQAAGVAGAAQRRLRLPLRAAAALRRRRRSRRSPPSSSSTFTTSPSLARASSARRRSSRALRP